MIDRPPARIAVHLCTRNPRTHFIERVLDGLHNQTIGRDAFHVVFVDNASSPPIDEARLAHHNIDFRIHREPKPGIVEARRLALSVTSDKWIVQVDDDNVLDPDYLENLKSLIREHPEVAVWGARISPDFLEPPDPRTRVYWPYLAIREDVPEIDTSRSYTASCLPCGAGMAVRREVLEHYHSEAGRKSHHLALSRKSGNLFCGEDTESAYCALDLGHAIGISSRLHLTHIMPPQRLEWKYLRRLCRSVVFSHCLLAFHRKIQTPGPGDFARVRRRITQKQLKRLLLRPFTDQTTRTWNIDTELGLADAIRNFQDTQRARDTSSLTSGH